MTANSASKSEDTGFYKLDVGNLPDELFQSHVSAQDWLKTATTVGKSGFPSNSLNQVLPIPRMVELERIVGIALYMVGNTLPFVLPTLLVLSIFSVTARWITGILALYVGTLYVIEAFYFRPYFTKLYKSPKLTEHSIKDNQYIFTERNTTKYFNVQVVWPASLQRPALTQTPVIFCAIPHGVAPFGVTAYPLWSKLWNDKVCHWTTAPIVLSLPIISSYMKKIGFIPAKAKNIMETLTKKEENVGVILDGIEGMFYTSENEERAPILRRKGIIKIALRAGAPIVPVYAFGHTSLYTIWQDPFGILKAISVALDAALIPFFGRFYWFLGPPSRVPVTVCLGEPVNCPQTAEPTQEDIDKYHRKLLDSFEKAFEQHKAACGCPTKKLKFV
jgi:1-acyl-sn-glycerol-3-phosphate acyltransferase